MVKRKRVGIALSGGGGRGFAHIGVLKVLEKHNISIDYISGTSIGALIGALYSLHPDAKLLEKKALDNDWKDLFSYRFFGMSKSLIKEEKMEEFLNKEFGKLTFKDLKIPLLITAVDLNENREIIFSKGSLSKAVRASISMPGFFSPIKNKERILIDGGILDPIPTEILKGKKLDIIVAVNINHIDHKSTIMNEEATFTDKKISLSAMKTASKSLQLMGSEFSHLDLGKDKANLMINIPLGNIKTLDFTHAKEAIIAGERAAEKAILKLKRLKREKKTDGLFDALIRHPKIRKIIKKTLGK
jgi:NTE family protein